MKILIVFSRPSGRFEENGPEDIRLNDGTRVRATFGRHNLAGRPEKTGAIRCECRMDAGTVEEAIDRFMRWFPDPDEEAILHVRSEVDPVTCHDYLARRNGRHEFRRRHPSAIPFYEPTN